MNYYTIKFIKVLPNGIKSEYIYNHIKAENTAEAIKKAERRAAQWHGLTNYNEIIIF